MRRPRKGVRERIQSIIDRHDSFKGSYFWTPPRSASGRRRMERMNSDELCFKHCGNVYVINQRVECSCHNVYYRLSVYVNAVKKDVRVLRRLT